MHSRLSLHEALVEALGSRQVYFQPPESIKMRYPAIVYSLGNIQEFKANNKDYLLNPYYNVTLIDEDPDSDIVDEIKKLPYCRFDRSYVGNNLNHWVFVIYINKEN